MKDIKKFINESLTKTELLKTCEQVKQENPKLNNDGLKNRVLDILGTEAVAENPQLTKILDEYFK